MQRIVIAGASGSGKSTLAVQLSGLLDIPHIELDALHWQANWVMATREVFRERVEAALAGPAWIVDGNYYSKVRDLVWPRADTLIWLDFPVHVCLWNALRRSLIRAVTRQELWSGNRESLRKIFLSRDSLLLWILQSHRKRKRDYAAALASPEYAYLTVHRFTTRAGVKAYVDTMRTHA